MKEYIVGFTQYGVNLDGKTNDELLNAFLRFHGGPQGAFDYIIKSLQFVEQHTNEANIIQEDIKEITEDGSS